MQYLLLHLMNTWTVIYREDSSELSSPLNKHLKLSSTPQKDITVKQYADSDASDDNDSADKGDSMLAGAVNSVSEQDENAENECLVHMTYCKLILIHSLQH